MIKLNLGCGFKKMDGYVNVDKAALCQPDQIVDLEMTPWPWEDNSVSEIVAHHTFEHLGRDPETWMAVLRELWRVCQPDAKVMIVVPHHRHDSFFHDCTHVRVITPVGMMMFDQTRNIYDYEQGGAESKLGLMNGIDLEVVEVAQEVVEPLRSAFNTGRISREQAELELLQKNNVIAQVKLDIRVVKPPRGEKWLAERAKIRPASQAAPQPAQ